MDSKRVLVCRRRRGEDTKGDTSNYLLYSLTSIGQELRDKTTGKFYSICNFGPHFDGSLCVAVTDANVTSQIIFFVVTFSGNQRNSEQWRAVPEASPALWICGDRIRKRSGHFFWRSLEAAEEAALSSLSLWSTQEHDSVSFRTSSSMDRRVISSLVNHWFTFFALGWRVSMTEILDTLTPPKCSKRSLFRALYMQFLVVNLIPIGWRRNGTLSSTGLPCMRVVK